jgi:hypothetical protein
MRRLVVFVIACGLLVPSVAAAELYKYKKADGTVVYTDNLAQLPPERREHYNKQREAREEKRRQLEQQIGKEELERREAEAKRQELARAELAESERAQRLAEINTVLAEIQKKRAGREAVREQWRQKMNQARDNLAKKLAEFQALSDKANAIAIQPDFSRLPGQNEELEKSKEKLAKLELEVDELVTLVEETIPEQARKEGIPPGWLR